MHGAAEELIDSLVLERVRAEINGSLISTLAIKGNPKGDDVAADILPSLTASLERINDLGATYTQDALTEMVAGQREVFQAALADGRWLTDFPGRRILQRFVGLYGGGAAMSRFATSSLTSWRREQHQPDGMAEVLQRILAG
jgi:hypothetical protein